VCTAGVIRQRSLKDSFLEGIASLWGRGEERRGRRKRREEEEGVFKKAKVYSKR
jgi:hypothetical protein